jgi:glycerophosphoryl diester phosphodiesterase
MQERVIVSSFNPLTLYRFRQIMPEVALGFLYGSETPLTVEQVMQAYSMTHEAAEAMVEQMAQIRGVMQQLDVTYEARHPYHAGIDAAAMERAKREGRRVNAWTVNDPARAVELRDLGVDAIITDVPAVLLRALRG